MNWSLGETRALAVKAARGADMDWGLADDAGFAVQWLEKHGAPAVTALASLLDWYDRRNDGSAEIPDRRLCPVVVGTAMSDSKSVAAGPLGIVAQPLLLAPFVVMANPQRAWCLMWNDVEVKISQQGLQTSAQPNQLLSGGADCRLEPGSTFDAGNKRFRVPGSESSAMERLNIFAARTYAPATEQSRLAGAGAGLNDND
uniref:DUF3726 domain-containing protein n=1 Tax=uncultured bacterium ws406H10 TaxID=1131831 RepID=I1X5G4_9BACT|nr:hypothetical protein ws406H10_0027 [uncultured bacterium ws406H10]